MTVQLSPAVKRGMFSTLLRVEKAEAERPEPDDREIETELVTMYVCPGCEGRHEDEDDARACCRPRSDGAIPVRVPATMCPVCAESCSDSEDAADCCLWHDFGAPARWRIAAAVERGARVAMGRAPSPAGADVDAALARLGYPHATAAQAAPAPATAEELRAAWSNSQDVQDVPFKPVAAPAPVAATPAAPAPVAAPVAASGDVGAAAAALVAALQAQQKAAPVDAETVRALVGDALAPLAEQVEALDNCMEAHAKNALGHAEALNLVAKKVLQLESRAPARVELTVTTDTGARKLDGEHFHPMFEKVLRLVAAGLNVMMVGPAGSGKTHMAEQVARALGRDFGSISFTSGASEAQMVGWLLPTGEGGRFEYAPSQFVELFERGNSLFLLDEMDRGDANMLMIGNSALANGYLNVPQRRHAPTVRRGKDAGIVAACNTFGTGQDYVYAGANVLDGATLDRFYVVHVDYDTAFEAALVGAPAPYVTKWAPDTDTARVERDCADLLTFVQDVRRKVAAAKLNRVVSTRMLQKGMAARRAGVPLAEVQKDLLSGWTRDELAKVGR